MAAGVTLAKVLAAQVAVEWYEAVAIVREVCERVSDPKWAGRVPELNQVHLSPNGYLDIGTANNPSQAWVNSTLPSSDQPNGIAAAWWDDLNPGGATKVFTQTLGTAPNRVLTVEWIDLRAFAATGTDINMQVKLYEGTGIIELLYGTMSGGAASWSYTSGVNGPTMSAVPGRSPSRGR